MAVSFPQLDVYYIDFAGEKNSTTEKREKWGERLLKAGEVCSSSRTFGSSLPSLVGSILIAFGIVITPGVVSSLKRLINDKKFFIIRSQQELDKFENAYGNEWVINEKSLQQKQYYIRHPKKTNRNLLIESKSFYDFIEDEQKRELVDYILSHCPAKFIEIKRVDTAKAKCKGSTTIKDAKLRGSVESEVSEKNIYTYDNPKGTQREPTLSQYTWLENSIMSSIDALSEGGSLKQQYESDYTFGLSLTEAKTIGLDLSKHEKFTYSIYVKC